jgi:hypothetical protein
MLVDVKAGNEIGRCCSPCRRMPFESRNEGSKRVSMTWRATSAWPYLESLALLVHPLAEAAQVEIESNV